MKQVLLTVLLCVAAASAFAEKESYDIVSYTPPAAWKKEAQGTNRISYTATNPQNGAYCQIFVLSSMNSKGSVDADFDHDWRNLVIKSYAITQAPQMTESQTQDGWRAKAGVASFSFNNGTSIAMLTTISGSNKTVSIVAVTNNQDYMPTIQAFLESVEMRKVEGISAVPVTSKPTALQGYMDYSPYTKTWTWKLRYPPPK